VKSRVIIALAASTGLTLTWCEYVWLLRPSVLKQLNPRVVRLVVLSQLLSLACWQLQD
jgi:hypothetical protein